MTKEELREMARRAGGIDLTNTRANVTVWLGTGTSDFLDAFAKLIAEHEREAIWNILFEYAGCDDLTPEDESLLKHLADLIRARGEA